jgi:hypothetical protein
MPEQWSHRPGVDPAEQLKELERTLGLTNLKDVSIQEVAGQKVLQILTQDKKYQITMTEV